LVLQPKQKVLETFSNVSVCDDDNMESEREGDAAEMASKADDGSFEGLQMPSIEPQAVEACLSLILHGSSSPMKVGTPPGSEELDFEPNNLQMMAFVRSRRCGGL
jgi:hypothetical protein